jgi:preprotein translocase subunit SecD
MLRRHLVALAAGAIVVSKAICAQEGTRTLTVDADEILSASIQLQPGTSATVVRLTCDERVAQEMARFTRRHVGSVLKVQIDGQTLATPQLLNPLSSGQMIISTKLDYPTVQALVQRLLLGDADLTFTVIDQ